jgi:tripartite-type tricarboxylate transporter receptor subunit TctC
MRIRILAKTMLSALVFLAFGQNAAAQEYPSRSVKIVVGYPPGGAVDSNARLIGQLLSERWKKPVVVENRSGAGSTIATASVAQASPDGYTILLASPAHTINATMYKKLPYDTLHYPYKMLNNLSHCLRLNPANSTTALLVQARRCILQEHYSI